MVLASEASVPYGFADYIEDAIRSVAGADATVRITILQVAPGAPLEAPKIDDEES